MDCDYCDESFSDELEQVEHTLDAHDDELTGHDTDDLKRKRNRLQREEDDGGSAFPVKTVGFAALVVVLVVGGGYGLMASGLLTVEKDAPASTGSNTLGAPGSTHEHAQFTVTVNGERIDFSQPRYQASKTQNRYVHFEGGDGVTIHKHATGVTIAYTLESLGFSINETCISTDTGETYCESSGGELSVTVNGQSVDPTEAVIQDGQTIRVSFSQN